MDFLDKLNAIRRFGGEAMTAGLPDETLHVFARDANLCVAVEDAFAEHKRLREEFPELMSLDEEQQIAAIGARLVNFYAKDTVNPYVSLAARGPWIVTTKGAVLHDSGGYGMLGLGHAPAAVLDALSRRHVMANVMTPSLTQYRLTEALHREIGHRREGGCPFGRFVFMNSGSEAVTVAARISDINAKNLTDPGGCHAGKPIRVLSLRRGFHGRTDRPAQFSDSTRRTYEAHLASFRDREELLTVAPNDLEELRAVFENADRQGWFIEAMFMEPVMGEGNPGLDITPEFYALARGLTLTHGSVLLIDSIQAGLRTHGCLSVVDYPGFTGLAEPDMETYSKALNAGQYPMSVLAMNERAAGLYRKGVYGNTMTSTPRAMDVGVAVLEALTPALRENIVARGKEFLDKLHALAEQLDGPITDVQGTGLLFSVGLHPSYRCYGADSTEEYMRKRGIGVIHGGENSLRFTPHFAVTSEEVDLIVEATREALLHGPRMAMSPEAGRAVG